MKKLPKKISNAVKQINRFSKDTQKLQNVCGRYKDVFAVYPHTLDMIPSTAKDYILSGDFSIEDDFSHSISITTPDELCRFYKKLS